MVPFGSILTTSSIHSSDLRSPSVVSTQHDFNLDVVRDKHATSNTVESHYCWLCFLNQTHKGSLNINIVYNHLELCIFKSEQSQQKHHRACYDWSPVTLQPARATCTFFKVNGFLHDHFLWLVQAFLRVRVLLLSCNIHCSFAFTFHWLAPVPVTSVLSDLFHYIIWTVT